MNPAENEYRISEKFNAPDPDLIIQSSDNTRFHIHRKYLEANTGAFPPFDFEIDGDKIVTLTESSVTLQLLFSFVYPQRHPELEDVPFTIIEPLAEAAEKYEVFSAMHICHLRMKEFIHTHPMEVLSYACRHDYPLVLSAAAEVAVALPLAESVRLMPPYVVMPWMQYIEGWMKVHREVQKASMDLPSSYRFTHVYGLFSRHRFFINDEVSNCCREWAKTTLPPILKRFIVGYSALVNLDALFSFQSSETKDCCRDAITAWKKMVEGEVKKIPKFKQFISSYEK